MSAPRRSDLVKDLLEFTVEIEGYLQSWTFHEYIANKGRQRTLERVMELLGEVASQLGDDAPDLEGVDWRGLIDMRIVLAHLYSRVDPKRLWEHARDDVPALRRAVQKWVDQGGFTANS